MSIAGHIEGDVNPLRGGDPRIDLILQPVLGYFSLNDLDIVGILCSKVTTTAGNAKPALGAAGVEAAIRSADRAAFAEGNLIGFFLGRGLRFLLSRRRKFFGF